MRKGAVFHARDRAAKFNDHRSSMLSTSVTQVPEDVVQNQECREHPSLSSDERQI